MAFVDVREQNELDQSGWIPGSVHAPRGMLEFYIDTASAAHMPVFGSGKRIVFYCAGGGRSAPATLLAQRMGSRTSPTWVVGSGRGRRPAAQSCGGVPPTSAAPCSGAERPSPVPSAKTRIAVTVSRRVVTNITPQPP